MELKEGEIISPIQLDRLLRDHLKFFKKILIKVSLIDYFSFDDYIELLNIKKRKDGFVYHLSDLSKMEPILKKICNSGKKQDPSFLKRQIESWVRDAFLRSGLCMHGNLDKSFMRRIKSDDDVIIAPDTNILLDCTITSILLPEIEKKIDEELKGCPNWILIAIPKLVMTEIERKSIRKFKPDEMPKKIGWPRYDGRIGRRALQEILELDTNISIKGLSIMTVGDIPINYDNFKKDHSRLDSEIRTQFRDFISQINFHKGVFFITQDRICAMMARAEGLSAIFLQKPEYKELMNQELINNDIAQVVYELIVTFGEIEIEKLGKFSIYWPGKHVIDWEESRIIVDELYKEKYESKKLLNNSRVKLLSGVKM